MAHTILVVEDEELNRKLFVSILQEQGYEVTGVADGEEALAIMERKSPALVLMDIMLPTMSGIEVFNAGKERGLLEHTKVYALTASMMPEMNEAGFDGVIMKPIRVTDMLGLVEKILRGEESSHSEDTDR
jgi:CheY-like chemotaxis protein